MSKKVILPAVAIVLVVGVVIGVVGVVHSNKKDGNDGSAQTSTTSTSRAVSAVCKTTDDEALCHKTLSNVNSSDPQEYIKAAVKSTVDQVIKALNMTDRLSVKEGNGTKMQMAVSDCKDLLEFAVDELQASMSTVGDPSIQAVVDKRAELKNWLSAVISYQQTCLDGLEDKQVTEDIQSGGLNDAGKLTSIALAIVDGISELLEAFNLNINVQPGSRRLLGHDGYPTWFSAADRKLLASQSSGAITPNAVVAKDGSGQYKTIVEALAAYPKKHQGRYVIYVKAGVYDEYITVTKNQMNIFMYGDGPEKTIVTGNKSYKGGFTTYKTATFSTVAEGFMAKSMGFKNTAGAEGHQAVALRVQGDMSAFFNCRFDGYQDTLYTQAHRQFYRDCTISGTIDFIFGDATAVIQNSVIIVRKPMDNQKNIITAHGRTDKRETTGLVIHNCNIIAEPSLMNDRLTVKSYLGRPWKAFSRTIFMESTIPDFIQPDGWLPWDGNLYLDTLYYAEYGNRGPGAGTDKRVTWKGYHKISKEEASQYTVGPFLQANTWLAATGVPFQTGFTA